ncbi:MAG TPA: LytTR family transcriptional regulator DNA-binding domain-containing protein [Bacteroidales bacterium]|nr:LytTR family transcriptional regulator DNA-binding domain-containing protein [Bacteroidales bacterium]
MNTTTTPPTTIIKLKTQKGNKPLNFNEILYLKASNKHTFIYLMDGQCIETNHLLKQYEGKLPQPLFCRCHNSYILNNIHVECINGNYIYLTASHDVIPLSRKWKQVFIDNYNIFKQSQISINLSYGLLGVK